MKKISHQKKCFFMLSQSSETNTVDSYFVEDYCMIYLEYRKEVTSKIKFRVRNAGILCES